MKESDKNFFSAIYTPNYVGKSCIELKKFSWVLKITKKCDIFENSIVCFQSMLANNRSGSSDEGLLETKSLPRMVYLPQKKIEDFIQKKY